MIAAMLMRRSGTSCAVDVVYEAPEITLDTLEPVVQAYRDAGLRATVLLGVADKPFLDSLPLEDAEREGAPREAPPPTLERILEVAEGAIERWHDPEGTIQIGIAPSAPQRCTDELLEATWRLAEERDVVWHTHVLETKTQRYTADRWHGRSFVEVLAERGYVGRRVALVHAVWLADRDIELFRETDTTMIHCLLSNLRIGDGIARLPALLCDGVRVALGTDGRGCDETLDMFELAKMTALVHKAHGESYRDWPTAADAFAMATRNASICTGHGERLGRIEPGAHGDLVLLDRDSLPFTPLLDPVRQLVYGAPSREVETVVVGGNVVVADGRLVGVDAGRMHELARTYAAAPPDPDDPGTEALMRLQDIVSGVYERAEGAELGLDSYIGTGLTEAAAKSLL